MRGEELVQTILPRSPLRACFLAALLVAAACSRPPEVAADAVPLPPEEPAPEIIEDEVVDLGQGHHQGIDVSHHDENIEWGEVLGSGVTFVYIKATEGEDYSDPLFAEHWKNAGAAGLHRGAYHFFRPQDDGESQARFFLASLGEEVGELIPAVDVEVADGVAPETLIAELEEWLAVVEKALGVKAMIYTDVNFWNDLKTKDFSAYPLWVAEYGVEAPTIPDGWTDWALWQFSRTTRIKGVEVPVDRSRTPGPLHMLHLKPAKGVS
jgi:lysozyme